MGQDERGKRDGTGPYEDSWMRQQGHEIGRRQQEGEECLVGQPTEESIGGGKDGIAK